MSVDRAKLAALVCPFVPNRYAMIVEVLDVGVACQKPEQLIDDRLEMQFLGGCEGKSLRQIESHLVPEHRQRPGAGTVMLFDAVSKNVLHQVEVLAHRALGLDP